MNPPDDTELMLCFKRNQDKEAFNELVRRHSKPLINFFYRLTWNQSSAEDLAQEVLIKLVETASRYEARSKFTTFLYTVARNLWIDKLRSGKAGVHLISLDNPIDSDGEKPLSELIAGENREPVEVAATEETVTRVKKLLSALPDEQRVILNLTYFEGMSYQEVAEVLDIPLGTVKSRLHAAIAKLKEMV